MTHTIKSGTYKLNQHAGGTSIYFTTKNGKNTREVYYSPSSLHARKVWAEIKREK